MRQLLQSLRDGANELARVPAPCPKSGRAVIQTTRSLVSAGTERMLVEFGRSGWIGKARQQPDRVRAVLNKVRAEGVISTLRGVLAKLDQPIPLGYCQVGRVVAIEGDRSDESGTLEPEAGEMFFSGNRVVSNGPHAEVVSVSRRLCANIPDTVNDDAAAFTPLAAIAWEGIGLMNILPGSKVVVTGLGLIGQLAVRILRACDCEVLGFDPSAERRALAEAHGANTLPSDLDATTAALSWSKGAGVAGVLITASTSSNAVVNQAARSCRYRGKVVLIGVVGLQLNRTDFYRNEVSFQVSCSYGRRDHCGPGSAQANFRQMLRWMSEGKLPVQDLITHRYPFVNASAAYAALSDREALGILLEYGREYELSGKGELGIRNGLENARDALLARTIKLRDAKQRKDGPVVALIGAGNFAARTLLPALAEIRPAAILTSVVSNQGASAYVLANKFEALRASTDENVIFKDAAVDSVFITTRHDAHPRQAIAALRSGKHVWVEKPLALSGPELDSVRQTAESAKRVLMVGFNRRFSPMAVVLERALQKQSRPYRIRMLINAGRLESDHWTLDPRSGGGRIVGEGCHFVDLARYLVGLPIEGVRCMQRDEDGQDGGRFEIRFLDQSVAMIDYRTDLAPHLPKEVIEVTGQDYSVRIHNWAKLTSTGLGGLSMGSFWDRTPRKGHREALRAFFAGMRSGVAPIPLDQLFEVSRWAIEMQSMTPGGELE